MNAQQRKYAIERVDAIEKKKVADLKTAHTVPAKWLDNAGRIALVRSGAVTLRDNVSKHGPLYLTDAFDLSAHEWGEHQDAGFEPAKKKVQIAAAKVRDQIMLGDAEEALRLLTRFASE